MTSRHPPPRLPSAYFLLPSVSPVTRSWLLSGIVVVAVFLDWHKPAPGHDGEDEGDEEGGGDHTEEDIGPPQLVDLCDNEWPKHPGH